jgi:hypothetical protein
MKDISLAILILKVEAIMSSTRTRKTLPVGSYTKHAIFRLNRQSEWMKILPCLFNNYFNPYNPTHNISPSSGWLMQCICSWHYYRRAANSHVRFAFWHSALHDWFSGAKHHGSNPTTLFAGAHQSFATGHSTGKCCVARGACIR